MPTHTSATTRETTSNYLPARSKETLLVPSQVIVSPETRLQYRIERLLGAGGFGQVYLAIRRGSSAVVPETVCIKVSARIDGWLREAYFGQLLDRHPRAIRVYDRFPLMRPDGQVLYYLAIEYACHGDLNAYLQRAGKGWAEATARREIAGILEVLRKLHRGQLLHRDLTPMNVFVCDNRRLKLGDFGIVRQQSDHRGITAGTLNASMVPSDILASTAPKWQARDDVYQVGQLLGMLVKGDARARIRPAEVRGLGCSDDLKEIVYRCIGERRKRYESADEMIEALRRPPARLIAGCDAIAAGRASRIHGHPEPAPQGGRAGGEEGRRRRASWSLVAHHRRRARASEPAAGRRPGRGPQADGDQAASREGAPHHAARGGAVLASRHRRRGRGTERAQSACEGPTVKGPGLWSSVFGLWSPVFGLRSAVCGCRPTVCRGLTGRPDLCRACTVDRTFRSGVHWAQFFTVVRPSVRGALVAGRSSLVPDPIPDPCA